MRTVIAGPAMVGKTRLAKEFAAERHAWRLNLDPGRQDPTPLTFASLHRPDGSLQGIRFIGGLSLQRDPIASVAAVSWAARHGEPLVVELPLDRPSPVFVHLLRRIVDVLRPDELIALGHDAAEEALQTTCRVERRPPLEGAERRPPKASAAWRKACWRDLFEVAKPETLPLGSIRLSGARLGSGLSLEREEVVALRSLVPTALHAEVSHGSLSIVAEGEPPPEAVHTAADHFGCETAHIIDPRAYDGVVCALENNQGEHFAVGRIDSIDFESAAITMRSPAAVPWPATRLHIGSLVLDEQMNEIGHLKPWQV